MNDAGTDGLLGRLDALIVKGNEVAQALGLRLDTTPEQWGVYRGWQAQALTCIGDLVGAESEYQTTSLRTRRPVRGREACRRARYARRRDPVPCRASGVASRRASSLPQYA